MIWKEMIRNYVKVWSQLLSGWIENKEKIQPLDPESYPGCPKYEAEMLVTETAMFGILFSLLYSVLTSHTINNMRLEVLCIHLLNDIQFIGVEYLECLTVICNCRNLKEKDWTESFKRLKEVSS
jgi:hypothetical protein